MSSGLLTTPTAWCVTVLFCRGLGLDFLLLLFEAAGTAADFLDPEAADLVVAATLLDFDLVKTEWDVAAADVNGTVFAMWLRIGVLQLECTPAWVRAIVVSG